MLLPLYAEDDRNDAPIITIALIAVNGILHGYLSYTHGQEAFWRWGLVPSEPTAFSLLSNIFVHADALHLAGNMLFLGVYGAPLERRLGMMRYLGLYLTFGILASLFYWVKTPDFDSDRPLVGASGAVAGVMGGFFVVMPQARICSLLLLFVFAKFPRIPAWLLLGWWFFLNWVDGQFLPGEIANEAHIGGFVAGFVLVAFVVHGKAFMRAYRRAEIDSGESESDPEVEYERSSALAGNALNDIRLGYWNATRAAATGRIAEVLAGAESLLRRIPREDRKFRFSANLLYNFAVRDSPKRNRFQLAELSRECLTYRKRAAATAGFAQLAALYPDDPEREEWEALSRGS